MKRRTTGGIWALSVAGVVFWLLGWGGCALNATPGDLGDPDGGGATGSGGTVGASSGVARGSRLIELTSAQASVLCDWTNLRQGGYGRVATCPSGATRSTNRSTLDCVNSTSALGGRCSSVTVGHIEDCANAVGSDLCKLETAPACVALVSCS